VSNYRQLAVVLLAARRHPTELVLRAVPGAAEGDHGVAGHGGGHRRVRRRLQRDHEAAFGLDREPGFGETGGPVLMHVQAGLVTPPRHGGVDPVLERRARRVGEKSHLTRPIM
jgi:hypothetical protein